MCWPTVDSIKKKYIYVIGLVLCVDLAVGFNARRAKVRPRCAVMNSGSAQSVLTTSADVNRKGLLSRRYPGRGRAYSAVRRPLLQSPSDSFTNLV